MYQLNDFPLNHFKIPFSVMTWGWVDQFSEGSTAYSRYMQGIKWRGLAIFGGFLALFFWHRFIKELQNYKNLP